MNERYIYLLEAAVMLLLALSGTIYRIRGYIFFKKLGEEAVCMKTTKDGNLKKLCLKYSNMVKLNALSESTETFVKHNMDRLNTVKNHGRYEKLFVLAEIYIVFTILYLNRNYIHIKGYESEFLAAGVTLTLGMTAIYSIFDRNYLKEAAYSNIAEGLENMKKSTHTEEYNFEETEPKKSDKPAKPVVKLSKEETRVVEEVISEFLS